MIPYCKNYLNKNFNVVFEFIIIKIGIEEFQKIFKKNLT